MQDGGTDQSNSFGGGIQLSDDVTATIRNSTIDGNSVNVTNPAGEPFGADAGICACGSAALTLQNAHVGGNNVNVSVLDTSDSGPSGPSALEADSDATIENVVFTGNSEHVTASSGDAGALGSLLFIFGGDVAPTITHSSITANVSTATAANGSANLAGPGLTNNGPLTLTNVDVERNQGVATGLSGFAQGGGIWNGQLFGGPGIAAHAGRFAGEEQHTRRQPRRDARGRRNLHTRLPDQADRELGEAQHAGQLLRLLRDRRGEGADGALPASGSSPNTYGMRPTNDRPERRSAERIGVPAHSCRSWGWAVGAQPLAGAGRLLDPSCSGFLLLGLHGECQLRGLVVTPALAPL